jgi:hypothetical protein
VLQTTAAVVQPSDFCKKKVGSFYPFYSPGVQMCTTTPPKHTSGGCFGDSGGPAIGQRADGTPVELGVISSGGPFCSTRLPNILTRVDFVSTWVSEWITATELGGPKPIVDPNTPVPLMTRPVAEGFAVYTLQDHFGRAFQRAKDIFGSCRRASRSRFRCEISWRSGRNIYGGVVSPFYARLQDAVVWNSHFRIEWAPLKCLRSNAPRCPIHVRRG